jgi:hypothetical protein
MRQTHDLRKGRLVAAVLSGSWRGPEFPPLDISEPDLDEVTPLLCSSGAAALGWRRVSRTPLRDSASAEVLHQSYRLQSLQVAIHQEKIGKVFRLLRQGSVDGILAKGWAAAGLYSDRDLRPAGDIDICVRPEQFKLAEEILRGPEANDCWVDLHKDFSEISESTFDDLFARSTVVSIGQGPIRLLGPEDHLALLCIHLLKHGAWRPLWLCDIGAAIESLPSTFDWDLVLTTSKRRARWVGCAIGLAGTLLGARIEHLPFEAGLTQIPGWLVPGVLDHWSRLYPGNRLPMRAAPLMADNLKQRRNIVKGILERWPDPITATFRRKGQFNNFPRLPYQLADFAFSATRFLVELPTKLQ